MHFFFIFSLQTNKRKKKLSHFLSFFLSIATTEHSVSVVWVRLFEVVRQEYAPLMSHSVITYPEGLAGLIATISGPGWVSSSTDSKTILMSCPYPLATQLKMWLLYLSYPNNVNSGLAWVWVSSMSCTEPNNVSKNWCVSG